MTAEAAGQTFSAAQGGSAHVIAAGSQATANLAANILGADTPAKLNLAAAAAKFTNGARTFVGSYVPSAAHPRGSEGISLA